MIMGAIFVGTIVAAFYFGDRYTMTLSAFIPLGWGGLAFWLLMESIVEVCRANTSHVIHNNGHESIRERDVVEIPWQEDFDKESKRSGLSLGSMCLIFTGGIDYAGFSIAGSNVHPILVFPSIYKSKEENNYHIYANMTRFDFRQLPLYLQDILLMYYPRMNPQKTPIYFGMTSHLDGSSTPENLRIERKTKYDNEEITVWRDKTTRLYEQIRREKESDRPDYIVAGKPLKQVEEEQ